MIIILSEVTAKIEIKSISNDLFSWRQLSYLYFAPAFLSVTVDAKLGVTALYMYHFISVRSSKRYLCIFTWLYLHHLDTSLWKNSCWSRWPCLQALQDTWWVFSLFNTSVAKTCLILTHHKICLKCLCRYRRTMESTAKMEMAKASKGMDQLLFERLVWWVDPGWMPDSHQIPLSSLAGWGREKIRWKKLNGSR